MRRLYHSQNIIVLPSLGFSGQQCPDVCQTALLDVLCPQDLGLAFCAQVYSICFLLLILTVKPKYIFVFLINFSTCIPGVALLSWHFLCVINPLLVNWTSLKFSRHRHVVARLLECNTNGLSLVQFSVEPLFPLKSQEHCLPCPQLLSTFWPSKLPPELPSPPALFSMHFRVSLYLQNLPCSCKPVPTTYESHSKA